METLQKLAVPIAIVIAGGMIAISLFFVNSRPVANTGTQPVVTAEIRGVQADDHIKGNPNARIVIVEYSDAECPFCQRFHETMNRIVAEYGASGDVAWVYRHWPIGGLHPNAPKEAEALECAAEQGGNEAFWSFTDAMFAAQPQGGFDTGKYDVTGASRRTDGGQISDIAASVGLDTAQLESCIDSGRHAERVQRDSDEIIAAGGLGTPHSIIIVDGEQIPLEGAQPYETVKAMIDSLL